MNYFVFCVVEIYCLNIIIKKRELKSWKISGIKTEICQLKGMACRSHLPLPFTWFSFSFLGPLCFFFFLLGFFHSSPAWTDNHQAVILILSSPSPDDFFFLCFWSGTQQQQWRQATTATAVRRRTSISGDLQASPVKLNYKFPVNLSLNPCPLILNSRF